MFSYLKDARKVYLFCYFNIYGFKDLRKPGNPLIHKEEDLGRMVKRGIGKARFIY